MRHLRTATLALFLSLAAAACGKARPIAGAGSGGGLSCTTCHGTAGRANGGLAGATYDPNQAAAPPVDANGRTAGVFVGAHLAHVNPGASGVYRPVACTECHPDDSGNPGHSNGVVNLTFAAATGANLKSFAPTFTQGNGTTTATTCATYCHGAALPAYAQGPLAGVWSWTGPAASCGSCHPYPPAAPHPASTACSGCHPATVNADNVSINVAGGKHINGVVDVVVSEPGSGGTACATCHGAIFDAMNGTAARASKHTLGAVAGVNDSPTDSGIGWTGPLSGNAPAARSCVNMCHDDHPHTLASPSVSTHEYNVYADASSPGARAAASRTSADKAKTDFDAAQAGGGLCVSCHQNPIAAGGPTVAKAAFGASAHNFTAASGSTWQYALHSGAFDRNCTKCHASRAEGTTPAATAGGSATAAVHGGSDPTLLAGTTRPAGNPAGFVCYNCHGSAAPVDGSQGNRSGKNVQGQIAKLAAGGSGHPANADGVHDSAAELAGAAFGNALGVAAGAGQRHASCLDCHSPHEAKPTAGNVRVVGSATNGNVAGPALHGAWGAALGGALGAFAAPAAANFTKTTIAAGTDLEATLCFKCHSAFYGALPTSPSGDFAETDQAREFNPANPSFHPVLASNSGTLGNTGNVIAPPWSRTSLMTCTDCHESEVTTDPNGPHGSAAKFVLKGPNTTWTSALQLTGGAMPAGTFCANCHAANFTGTRFNAHTNPVHSGINQTSGTPAPVTCMSCHVAIPHGSGHVGMLVSVGVGGTPAGGVQVTDSAPYAVAPRLFIKSYPATNSTNWGTTNCGCDGNTAHP